MGTFRLFCTAAGSSLRPVVLALLGLVFCSSSGVGQTIPFTLQGPGVDPNDFEVTLFSEGLNFPVGMTELTDGSILVGTTNGTSFFGSSRGSLIRLADTDADGVADVQQTLVSTVPGGKISSVKRAGDLVAVTGQGNGVPITLYRTGANPSDPLSYVGQFNLGYPGGGWLHPHSALAMREAPDAPGEYDLYFQLGSDTNIDVTTRTVSLTSVNLGLSTTLQGEAIHHIRLSDQGGTVTATSIQQIASGLRNGTGMAFDPDTGDFYIGDNGIDGLVNPNEPTSADELNVIRAADLGGAIEDFGFPHRYEEYRTGTTIGSGGIDPLVAYQPIPSPDGAEGEGVNEIAMAPEAFPEMFRGGVFAGMHGIFSSGGLQNEENPLVFANPDTGEYFHFIGNDVNGVGHLDGLLTTYDTLYVADISPAGGFGRGNANEGRIYAIRALASILAGDLNGDGEVNFGDLDGFAMSLTDPAGYQSANPGRYPDACDLNGDGNCNFGDLAGFSDLLAGGATSSTVPEPSGFVLILLAFALRRRSGRS